jgi:hypothetical protein
MRMIHSLMFNRAVQLSLIRFVSVLLCAVRPSTP